MPLEAVLAQIWWRSPCNPDAVLAWPVDKVLQWLRWVQVEQELAEGLNA